MQNRTFIPFSFAFESIFLERKSVKTQVSSDLMVMWYWKVPREEYMYELGGGTTTTLHPTRFTVCEFKTSNQMVFYSTHWGFKSVPSLFSMLI